MKEVKLAVVGSRTFSDYATLNMILNKIKNEYNLKYIQIISGGAKGADTFAERYAEINKIPKLIFKADWNKFGKRAGMIRNVDIIKNCDICVAFWDGESHGTAHDIKLCKQYDKECWVYTYIENKLYQDN